MTRLPKGLYAALLASLVLTVLVLLQPAPEGAAAADDLLAAPAGRDGGRDAGRASGAPAWERGPLALPAAPGRGGFAGGGDRATAAASADPAGRTFAPAAAPVVVAPPPAAPSAPEPGFSYLGRFVDGGRTQVFLSQDGEVLSVPVGGTVGERWRVEAVAAGSIELTYLPLGVSRQLAVGER